MGRHKQVTDDQVRYAMAQMSQGKSQRQAAIEIGIRATSLRDRIRGLTVYKAPSTPPPAAAPPAASPANQGGLQAALTAAGLGAPPAVPGTTNPVAGTITPPKAPVPPTPSPLAPIPDGEYCIQQVKMLKGGAVLLGGLWAGVPLDDPKLQALAAPSKNLEEATRAAAPELAPILKGYLGETMMGAFLTALAVEVGITYSGLKDLKKKYDQDDDGPGPGKAPPKPNGDTPASEPEFRRKPQAAADREREALLKRLTGG